MNANALTVVEPSEAVVNQKNVNFNPEFLRIPDVERVFGIKRGILYRLISSGQIKSVNLRKKGAQTGLRLVSFESVRRHLLSLSEGGCE